MLTSFHSLMKKTFLTLSFFIAALTFCHSQTIESEKVFGGYKFTQNGEPLTMDELTTKLNSNEESAKLINKAKNQNMLASVLAGAGGALVGYPLGTAIGGGEPNWMLAGVGAGIIAVAIPISSGANKKTVQAIDIYNSGNNPKKENIAFTPELFLVSNNSGMGLALKF